MQGDNFRPVSAETSAWVLQQHFAIQAVPIDVCEPLRVRGYSPAPKRKTLEGEAPRLSSLAKRIMDEVSDAHQCPPRLIFSRSIQDKVVAARHEFWSRCRHEIYIGSMPASFNWIGRQSGHQQSSVIYGVKQHAWRTANKAGSWRRVAA